ncbi:MAG: PASTA domain-containing protein, partial [Planctomycetota bacterium]
MSTNGGASFDYMGLYANVEQVDSEYLEDHIPGRHDYGFLYKKTEYNGDYQQTRECDDPDLPPLPDACVNPFVFNWYPFDHATYMTETVPPPADWLTQTPARVNEDQLLGMAVCENFTANSDALMNKGNNYYYYDWATHPTDPNIMDPAYKEPRLYIPWDLDTSAGSGTDTMSILDDQSLGGHLFQSLIKQQDESGTPYGYDTYRNQYMAKYVDIINGPLAKANVLAMIDAIETAITPALMDEIHSELVPEMTTEGAAVAIANDFNTNRSYYSARWDAVSAELAALAPLAGIEVLSDSFEGTPWDENWDASPHSWVQASDEFVDGAYSAKLEAQTTSTFTTDPLDAVGASAINVRFWIMKDDTDAGEDIELQYYNGSTYNTITDLDLLGADDEWLVYSARITDSQYFVSDFQVRIDGSPERNENIWLDKVEISKEVPIPDVVGLDETTAEATLVAANYVVGTKTYVCDASAAGTVLSQNPTAGTSAPLGTAVDLTISSGPPVVPDYTGMDVGSVTPVPNTTIGAITYVCDASPAGTVIGQSAVGAVACGAVIDLTVSNGPPSVPSYVGGTEAAAIADLGALANVSYGSSSHVNDDVVPAGDVISQSETGVVACGAVIDLVVSLGLPVIPDVTGQTEAAAEAALIAASFVKGTVTTAYSDTVAAGDVISQSPVGGTAAVSGTAVDLVVSLGLPIIPDVTGQAQATAEANIVAATFTVGTVTTAYSDTVAAGDVISQSQVGPATSGTAVDLVVSLGLPIIPDVTGQAQATAEANIVAATFTVGTVTTAYSDTVAAGDVISQSQVGPATS